MHERFTAIESDLHILRTSLTFDVLLSRVDAMTVRMVNKPESMDVIVATNRKRVTYTCTYLPREGENRMFTRCLSRPS